MTLSRPVFAALAALVTLAPAARADGLKVSELKTQKVGPHTYFTVRFEPPADYRAPELAGRSVWWMNNRPQLARLPRLVPQDDNTKGVYLRLRFPDLQNAPKVPG